MDDWADGPIDDWIDRSILSIYVGLAPLAWNDILSNLVPIVEGFEEDALPSLSMKVIVSSSSSLEEQSVLPTDADRLLALASIHLSRTDSNGFMTASFIFKDLLVCR